MEEKLVFCENCRDDTGYVVEERKLTGNIRGVQYHYNGWEARCKECGELIYVPAINDDNLTALYDVYREKNNIIPLKALRSIPEKYGIGKRPLSVLLGWGEQTLSRYLSGDIPSYQYSETLKRLASDPAYYLELLEKNKDKLTSAAYTKSKKAVEAVMRETPSASGKMESVIDYLLNRCQDITPLALQKALYYIQGFYYAFFGSFIFDEDCQAWAHGPVYKSVYARYANYHFDPISRVEEFDSSVFTTQEKAVLDSVIKNLCCYSGKTLERFTHSETPWIETRGEIPESAPSDRVIDKELIGSYFLKMKEKYSMVTPSDIRSYATSMFVGI